MPEFSEKGTEPGIDVAVLKLFYSKAMGFLRREIFLYGFLRSLLSKTEEARDVMEIG